MYEMRTTRVDETRQPGTAGPPLVDHRRWHSMTRWTRYLALLSLLVGAVLLNACGKSIDVAEWTEEVKLHDGQMVTVWRKARAYSGGLLVRRGTFVDWIREPVDVAADR